MKTYKEHVPTSFDTHIPLKDREHWLVLPCARNRDSNCLEKSNFAVALTRLGGESDTVEVHRFGHWGNGWYEIIIVDPASPTRQIAEEIEADLEQYPVLDENDFSDREHCEAQAVWRNCYNSKERIEYIREHRDAFEFKSFADMRECVRGEFFNGNPKDLI